jgi:membrane protease YdiL (CAAX protease family)
MTARDHTASANGRGDVRASMVLIFPLLLIYQLAILVVPAVVATDPISRILYSACQGRSGYLLAQAGIATCFLLWIHTSGRVGTLSLAVITPVLMEAIAIAVILWLGLPILVHRLVGLGLGASAVSAIGAGVYEEIVFRLLLVSGAVRVARAAGIQGRWPAVIAVLLASVVFAAAHHVGAAGESFHWAAFCFRALAGIALGTTFWFRSLAHAVYAHVVYDLLVLYTNAGGA